MADLTPPNPADVAPGWLGVVVSGLLVLVFKPLGLALARAAGRLLASVGVQWDLGRQARAQREGRLQERIDDQEQDIRERDALLMALTADVAMLRERVASREADVVERDREIVRLRRELQQERQRKRT